MDVALEMAGGDLLAQTLETLAPLGRAVSYGMVSGVPGRLTDNAVIPLLYDRSPNQSLHSFNLGLWFGLRPHPAVGALQRLIGWVADGQLEIPVGHTLPLDQAADAHRLVESRRTTGKVVLKP